MSTLYLFWLNGSSVSYLVIRRLEEASRRAPGPWALSPYSAAPPPRAAPIEFQGIQ